MLLQQLVLGQPDRRCLLPITAVEGGTAAGSARSRRCTPGDCWMRSWGASDALKVELLVGTPAILITCSGGLRGRQEPLAGTCSPYGAPALPLAAPWTLEKEFIDTVLPD